MEYNYVIFGSDWDLYKQSYSDISSRENVHYIQGHKDGKRGLIKKIYLLHCSEESRKKLNLPFRGIWNSTYFKNEFKDDKPLCFIYMRNWLDFEYVGLIDYLKKKYPSSKHVLFYQDLFWKTNRHGRTEDQYAGHLHKQFDLILSFDQNDCERYRFTYHPLVFSSYHGQLKERPFFDIYFLGKAKNRLNDIIACFEKLWENGVTTDIYLVGVDDKDQIYKDKIHYISHMEYSENLQHVLHSNCELEIMQTGGFGYTQRMCEVISLDKKLITNNPTVHEAPFYNPDYIFQIKSAEDITSEMCEKIKKHEPVDYHYKENLSPVELLQFIEKHLSE